MKDQPKESYSHHIFLFAFKWEVWKGSKRHGSLSLTARTRIKEVEKLIDTDLWESFQFEPKISEGINTYNEYSYFYDFARDALNLDEDHQTFSARQYQYRGLTELSQYIIQIKGEGQLVLQINEILLNFYENGVGIMSFHLENQSVIDFNKILKINEYGRRIYPQFLGKSSPYTNDTKYSFLAEEIILRYIHSAVGNEVRENFEHYDNMENVNKMPFVLPKHIGGLLGPNFTGHKYGEDKGKVLITPMLDDRMFVMCYLYDNDRIKRLGEYDICQKSYAYAHWENDTAREWYRYLFVDDSTMSCWSQKMFEDQMQRHTYDRWIESPHYKNSTGQLYGISRYSFMVLVSEDKTGYVNFNRDIISVHFKSMYFQMVMMNLLQRAYVINFGGEIARISQRIRNKDLDIANIRNDISNLYLQYIKFVNRIYFREVTSQEQGIELYDKLQEHHRIREHVKDLDGEMQELNNYAQTVQSNRLSSIAAAFLPAALIAGIFGFTNFPDWAKGGLSPTQANLNFYLPLLIVFLSIFFSNQIVWFVEKIVNLITSFIKKLNPWT